jgi:hypothetical protein
MQYRLESRYDRFGSYGSERSSAGLLRVFQLVVGLLALFGLATSAFSASNSPSDGDEKAVYAERGSAPFRLR